jgi:phage gp36-like protein
MAEYCTVEDIERLGINAQVLDALTSEEYLTPAVQTASAMIDEALSSGGFVLPLVGSISPTLKEAAAVLAAWTAVATRGLKPGEDLDNNPLYRRYQEKLRWLELVAKGTIVPVVTDSSTPGIPGGTSVTGVISSNSQRGWQASTSAGEALPFQGSRR